MSRIEGRAVALLQGGVGSEREVSLATGAAMQGALERLGCEVTVIDATPAGLRGLAAAPPSCAVLALHGGSGEDGRVQGYLDVLGVPYTGSGVLASALAMDKLRSKQIFTSLGIPTPEWTVLDPGASGEPPFLPCVAKVSCEGSSVGVHVLKYAEDWPAASAIAGRGEVFFERWIDGRELTVAVFEGEPLGVLEVRTVSGQYDYEAKYQRGDNTYTVIPLDDQKDGAMARRTAELGREAYAALGCRGMARVDVMFDGAGPWVLEVNTLPGMTGSSLVPKIAAARGWSFDQLVEEMVLAARSDA